MEIQLQELIDQIKQNGVEVAEAEAKRIVDAANAEAERIISGAQNKADKILEDAKTENERMLRSSEEAIRQAGRRCRPQPLRLLLRPESNQPVLG